MRIAYFDCPSGISGDMTLGALVDSGVDAEAIRAAVTSLGLPCELKFDVVRRCGFRALHAQVVAEPEHAHRHLHHIEALIDASAVLTIRQKELSKSIFRALGQAEAHVHGIPLAKVHFHEVGAVDSIADIVGAAVGLDLLGVDRIEASPVATGTGFVEGAHGRMPVPTPATAELLKGIPLAGGTIEKELTTPTGAAILRTVCQSFGPMPPMIIESIGLGAGTRDLPGQGNILRLLVGIAQGRETSESVVLLETNLDDTPGEVVGYTMSALLDADALDVFLTPIQMKKNRPGVMISVLCREGDTAALERILFRETTTLGIRRTKVDRRVLRRQAAEVETQFGTIAGKLRWLDQDHAAPVFSPEYESCAKVARQTGASLREVYQAAIRASEESLTLSAPPGEMPDQTTMHSEHEVHHHHHHHHHHDHDQDHGHDHDH